MKSVCQYVNCDWVHRVLLQRRGFVQAQAPSCVHPRLCCRFGVEVRLCKGQWSRFQLFDNMFATDNCYSVAWLSCDRWNMAGRKSMMFAPHKKAFKIRARAHAQLENWKEALNRESSNIAGKFAIPVSHFFTGFSEDFRTNPGHSKPLFLATFSHSLGSRSYCGTLHCSALGLVCLVCLVVQDNTSQYKTHSPCVWITRGTCRFSRIVGHRLRRGRRICSLSVHCVLRPCDSQNPRLQETAINCHRLAIDSLKCFKCVDIFDMCWTHDTSQRP